MKFGVLIQKKKNWNQSLKKALIDPDVGAEFGLAQSNPALFNIRTVRYLYYNSPFAI
jgi:hypothetical protein